MPRQGVRRKRPIETDDYVHVKASAFGLLVENEGEPRMLFRQLARNRACPRVNRDEGFVFADVPPKRERQPPVPFAKLFDDFE